MADDILERVRAELGRGDDAELFALAVGCAVRSVERVLDTTEPALRDVLLRIVLVPSRSRDVHPDNHAIWRLCWTRAPQDTGWTYVGPNPRVKRRRGRFSATLCLPTGTRRAAFADIPLLWRPRLPWAPPEDTEMGRQRLAFSRDARSRWHHRGTRVAK